MISAQAPLPNGAYLLPKDADPKMMHLLLEEWCDRASDGYKFSPLTENDIRDVENDLTPLLHGKRAEGYEIPEFPGDYVRQYVGFSRDGRRFLCGNAVRIDSRSLDRLRRIASVDTVPLILADGGTETFGFEYDVEARQFTSFAVGGTVAGGYIPRPPIRLDPLPIRGLPHIPFP